MAVLSIKNSSWYNIYSDNTEKRQLQLLEIATIRSHWRQQLAQKLKKYYETLMQITRPLSKLLLVIGTVIKLTNRNLSHCDWSASFCFRDAQSFPTCISWCIRLGGNCTDHIQCSVNVKWKAPCDKNINCWENSIWKPNQGNYIFLELLGIIFLQTRVTKKDFEC